MGSSATKESSSKLSGRYAKVIAQMALLQHSQDRNPLPAGGFLTFARIVVPVQAEIFSLPKK